MFHSRTVNILALCNLHTNICLEHVKKHKKSNEARYRLKNFGKLILWAEKWRRNDKILQGLKRCYHTIRQEKARAFYVGAAMTAITLHLLEYRKTYFPSIQCSSMNEWIGRVDQ